MGGPYGSPHTPPMRGAIDAGAIDARPIGAGPPHARGD
jgi:hypothetical protein